MTDMNLKPGTDEPKVSDNTALVVSKSLTTREEMAKSLQIEVEDLSAKEAEALIVGGNLAMLTPANQLNVYAYHCRRIGVPLVAQPFIFLTFNNKKVLYAKKECAEMLRSLHKVSVEVLKEELTPDFYTVWVRAKMPDGRFEDNLACVPLLASNKLEVANKKMACQSKALRRVTLAITGCGLSDSEDAPAGAKVIDITRQPLG